MTHEAKGDFGREDINPDRYVIDASDAGWRMTPERYLAREIRRLLPDARDITMSWTVATSNESLEKHYGGKGAGGSQTIFGTRTKTSQLLRQLDQGDPIHHVAAWAMGRGDDLKLVEAVFEVSFRASS